MLVCVRISVDLAAHATSQSVITQAFWQHHALFDMTLAACNSNLIRQMSFSGLLRGMSSFLYHQLAQAIRSHVRAETMHATIMQLLTYHLLAAGWE